MSSFTSALTVSPLDDGANWVVLEPFTYVVGDLEKSDDKIVVTQGFSTDFASIPRALWFVLPKWGKYGNAAVVHDYIYWHQDRSRTEADGLMLEGMKHLGVPRWQRVAIYHAVRWFGWLAWKHNRLNLEKHGVQSRVVRLGPDGRLPRNYQHDRPGLLASMSSAEPDRPPSELIHTSISLESISQPGCHVRHRGGEGVCTPVSNEMENRQATFVVRQGLAGGASISLESVRHPGHFLRHASYRIRLGAPDGSDLFGKDASFLARPGLCGEGWSFESVNFPGLFLRRCDLHLWIDDNQGERCDRAPEEEYRRDGSFDVVAGLHQYVDPERWYRLKTLDRGKHGECLECLESEADDSQRIVSRGVDAQRKRSVVFTDKEQDVDSQLWRFEPDGLFFRLKVKSRGDGECLEGNGANLPAHRGASFMDTRQNVPGQLWMIVPEGQWFRLQTKARGPERSLEGNGAQSWVKNGASFLDGIQRVTGQMWSFEEQQPGR